MSARDALLIGLAQILALMSGTSRSGITITAALFLVTIAPPPRLFLLARYAGDCGALLVMLATSHATSMGMGPST